MSGHDVVDSPAQANPYGQTGIQGECSIPHNIGFEVLSQRQMQLWQALTYYRSNGFPYSYVYLQ